MAVIKLRKKKKFSISTSSTEIQHLIISWLSIALIFTILNGVSRYGYLISFFIAAFTVGLGFLCHEAAHKFVAQKYGCFAEFRADFPMLIIAVVMAVFFGFTFVAPGAVWIHGNVTRQSNGKISAAGPITNFVLAIIFFLLALLFSNPFMIYFCATGMLINTVLGLFNMIPFWIFDGSKIWRWSIPVYLVMAAFGVGLIFLRKLLFQMM
ncbi:MAG: site-2 protease family protein [Nanoarchaeota archaeon]|nr:site-2 protease family protein [Nanoarchaeota archaeon]